MAAVLTRATPGGRKAQVACARSVPGQQRGESVWRQEKSLTIRPQGFRWHTGWWSRGAVVWINPQCVLCGDVCATDGHQYARLGSFVDLFFSPPPAGR